MKTIIILFSLILLSGCVTTHPKPEYIDKLNYVTVETAKKAKPDSLVIVKENNNDYVFKKEKDGKLTLIREFVSEPTWVNLPVELFIIIMAFIFLIGLISGLMQNT